MLGGNYIGQAYLAQGYAGSTVTNGTGALSGSFSASASGSAYLPASGSLTQVRSQQAPLVLLRSTPPDRSQLHSLLLLLAQHFFHQPEVLAVHSAQAELGLLLFMATAHSQVVSLRQVQGLLLSLVLDNLLQPSMVRQLEPLSSQPLVHCHHHSRLRELQAHSFLAQARYREPSQVMQLVAQLFTQPETSVVHSPPARLELPSCLRAVQALTHSRQVELARPSFLPTAH